MLAVFRCDASPSIGAGHAIRCLALAEELKSIDFKIVFAVRAGTKESASALADSGFDFLDLSGSEDSEAAELLARLPEGCDMLVIDHYSRDVRFERECRDCAGTILVIDDATARTHDCDILVDSAAQSAKQYKSYVPAGALVLAGPKFALLRRSFRFKREAAIARRDGRPVKNILVSFGATDPRNITPMAVSVLNEIVHGATLTIALSGQAEHLAQVKSLVGGRVSLAIDASDMPALMTEADLAVGAAGATAFERAALGLPTAMLTIADNQRGIADLFVGTGAAMDAGRRGASEKGLSEAVRTLVNNASARIEMARSACTLVDGWGAVRVAHIAAKHAVGQAAC